MSKKLRGFTLVELMVAMAIIAVLMGLAVFGIGTAQRILRDNQRRDALKNMAAIITAHYADKGDYPSAATIQNSGVEVSFGTGYVVPLTGPAKAKPATGNSQTTTDSSVYCYAKDISGYRLGVQLEDGVTWFELGTSSTKCASSLAPVQ